MLNWELWLGIDANAQQVLDAKGQIPAEHGSHIHARTLLCLDPVNFSQGALGLPMLASENPETRHSA